MKSKIRISMLSGSAFQSSCQFVKRLLVGTGSFFLPRRSRKALYPFFSPGFVLRPLLPELNGGTSFQNSLTRSIETLANINSSTNISHPVVVERLNSRGLMKVHGSDSVELFQTIVTADVSQLSATEPSKSCHYTMLLSKDGRVLYDVLLYKVSADEYWLEYDAIAQIPLRKHLEMFTPRKRVRIEPIDDMSVWVVYQSSDVSMKTRVDPHFIASHLGTKILGSIVMEDPRVSDLGCRVILQRSVDLHSVLYEYALKFPSPDDCYSIQRYKLGIGEGIKDHPPHECLPLECNLDYLGGIHFGKDYYLGKELTTHIHKTNFTWRRLMPVMLSHSSPSFSIQEHCIPFNCPLVDQKGLMVGRLRNNLGNYGLATVRVEAALDADAMKLKGFNIRAEIKRPSWWPDDLTQDGRRRFL